MSSEKKNYEEQQRVLELLKLPENKYCADCGARGAETRKKKKKKRSKKKERERSLFLSLFFLTTTTALTLFLLLFFLVQILAGRPSTWEYLFV
jgi:hypothetical protein